MAGRGSGWLAWTRDVWRALKSDPVLLLPAAIIVLLALTAAYLAWRFL